MLVAMALALGLITYKVVELQTVHDPRIDRMARRQSIFSEALSARRGSILDRHGAVLAMSLPRTTVFADPGLITEPGPTAAELAPLLGLPVAAVLSALTAEGRYEPLARDVEPDVVARIRRLEEPGIGFQEEPKRFTPGQQLAGPVIGTVTQAGRGAGGLEGAYDSALRGRAGRVEGAQDPIGRVIPAAERNERPAVAGADLVLTIDQSLQFAAEQHLVSEVTATRAQRGMAVVADVRTGDILAIAQVDGAHGRTPARPSPATAPNRLFTDPFEPGSTNKVITAATALETGVIGMDTLFAVEGSIKIGDGVYADDEPHGTEQWTVRDILERSSNVGTIKIADLIGRPTLDRSMRNFGYGARTPVDFPGESAGILHAPDEIDPSIMGSMPVGYGLATTPVQTLQVYMTLANGGRTRPLRLVDATIDAEGRRHTPRSMPSRRIVSEETAAALRSILTDVVRSGTGTRAAVPGTVVAGKTGTSRKAPYTPPLRYMASFAGFLPADAPELAAVVVLDEPEGEVHGGAVAAPVFSAIMQDALRLRAAQVPAAAR
jgi:cell division protein FtsI (penicillin-binding protein 3)